MEFSSPGPDRSEAAGAMAAVAAGPASWREWYDAHARRLLLYVRQWLPDRADAEDAVQAGFVKFWKHCPQPSLENVPLLFATVRCAALDLLKAKTRAARRDSSAGLEFEDCWWDAPTLEAQERAQMLQQALQKLPEAQREVIMLKIWGEMTFAEVAQTLGENQNTIAARYRAALAALKKLMPDDPS